MNSLQKLLAYKAIQPYLSNADWLDLRQKLLIPPADIRRLVGRDVENYFILLCLGYESIETVVSLSEEVSKLAGVPTGDCILVLRGGRKLLVEVKSTINDDF